MEQYRYSHVSFTVNRYFRGKVCVVVNVATNWGLTKKNYAQLQDLYTRYSSMGLCILAFPCNQFGGQVRISPCLIYLLSVKTLHWYIMLQEPGTDAEIKEAARNTFNLTFDFFSKINVNGSAAHPLFTYLQNALPGALMKCVSLSFGNSALFEYFH